jgi:hypothetical protein
MEQKIKLKQQEATVQKITVQPYLLCVGPVNDLDNIMIVLDSVVWKQSNVKKAFFNLFKLFFVFDLKYPLPSSKLWTFIQIVLFDMKTKNDKLAGLSSIVTLANDLGMNINTKHERE